MELELRSTPAASRQKPHMPTDGPRSCFFSGTAEHPVYVDFFPAVRKGRTLLPILMLHGGFHTGASYIVTPDGRSGWAQYFSQLGHDVYVADWPGHGRSPANAGFSGLSTREIAEAIAVLVQDIGPAIVFAHSAGGPLAWWIADQLPESVAAVVGIAPGPPSNMQRALPDDADAVNAMRYDQEAGCPVYSDLSKPVYPTPQFIASYWANASRFPAACIDAYTRSLVAESARVLNERFNIGNSGLKIANPAAVGQRPIVVITGENDPRHPRSADEAVAAYFGADFIWLPDIGITGNGHMLMIEDNSDEIAARVAGWLSGKGLR